MSTILFCAPKAQVLQGDTFDLSVIVRSDTDYLTGLDFQFTPTPSAALIGRDMAGSFFPDTISADLSGDLGGSIANVAAALPPGEYLVATFRFRVEGPAAPVTITPRAFPGTTGYATQAPGFAEHAFSGFQGAFIDIPEPSLAIALITALLMRRRK